MTEFQLLGPVEIRAPARPAAALQPRQRHILAALLVDPYRPVAWTTLIDRVWGAQPPVGARTAMRSHVSRIRQALRAAADHSGRPVRLIRDSGGYQLQADPDQIDLHRQRRLVGQARAAPDGAERARLLREAVGLWRGEPLAGLTGEWAGRMRSAWQHERLDVMAAWADAELALNNATAVVAVLGDLAEEHPLVEPVAAVHLRALHAVGRTAEAIDRYMRITSRLADELGVSPGTDLRRAHQTLLRDAPTARIVPVPAPAPAPPATVPTGVPAQLPADARGFTGRRDHLERLDALLDDHATGLPIALIRGTAGVGKTALAVHWAHRVAARFPGGQLYLNLRGFDPVGRAMTPAEALRHCLVALDLPARRIPADLDTAAALYRSELAGRRMLVLLDNARDATQVRPLLPGASRCLVVITSRDRMTGLVAAEAAHVEDLDLLSTDEAAQMLGRRLGADRVVNEWQAVTSIIEHCARLPLALAIAAARAAARPGAPLAALAGDLDRARDPLDTFGGDDPHTDLRTVLAHSYHALGEPARRMFRLLSLHPGPELAAPAAAAVAAVPSGEAFLAELARVSLITEHAPGRYALHDLLRAYAAELVAATDPDRDAARLRFLDHYLHTAHAADRRLYPAREPVALSPPQPGAVPETFADDRSALAWFTAERATLLAALDHAAEHGLDTYTWQLVWTMRTYLSRRGHWAELAAITETALAAAVRLGDPLVQARTHHQLGTTYTRLGRFDEAERELHLALDQFRALGHLVGHARAHHHLSHLYERRHRPVRSLAHAEQALDLYRAAGHRNGEAHALNGLGWYSAQLGDHRRAEAACRRALALFQELGDRQGAASAWDSLGYVLRDVGDHTEAVACYREALALFRSFGNRYHEADTLSHLGDAHRSAGDPAAARRDWSEAVAILTELRHPDAHQLRARLEKLTPA